MRSSKTLGWKVTIGMAFLIPSALGPVGSVAPYVLKAAPAAAVGDVTFTKDIAPILQRSCENCHRKDGVAPMSFRTYEEVRPWARAIKQRTSIGPQAGVMPPWYMEKNIGIQKYQDDPSLSAEEIAKIAKWADGGALGGNPADMPPSKHYDDSVWHIGTPDLIVKSADILVKAGAPDWWGEIEPIPIPLTEDRYVAAVEIKEVNDADAKGGNGRDTVGGRFVWHHLIYRTQVGLDTPDTAALAGLGDSVVNWPVHEVGRNPDFFDPKAAVLLKAGSYIVSDSLHTHSNGRDTRSHLEFGYKLMPKGYKPTFKRSLIALGNGVDIDIAGMQKDQQLHAYAVLHREHEDHLVRAPPACSGHTHVPRGDLGLQHPDADLRRLRPQLGARLQLRGRCGAAPAERHHPPHHRLHGQLAVEQERAGPEKLAGVGQPVGGQHVHRPRQPRVPDRRAVPGGDGAARGVQSGTRRHSRLPALRRRRETGSDDFFWT